MDIKETKKNIEYWESEAKKALAENNISKAIGCKILADNLRKKIGEEEKEQILKDIKRIIKKQAIPNIKEYVESK